MNVQTNNPETLIVTRDGLLDDEYYDQIYALKRQDALKRAGHDALQCMTRIPTSVGRNMLSLLSDAIQSVNANSI